MKMMKRKMLPLIISIILLITLMASCLVLEASASDVVATTTHSGAATPTNLTGYTVTVPAGWTCSASYGMYDITYEEVGAIAENTSLYIGYNSQGRGVANTISLIGSGLIIYNDSRAFSISIEGGDDVSNTSLIQWFADNNATFTLTNPDADFPVLAGTYHFNRDSLIASISGTVTGDFYLESSALDDPYSFDQISITAGDPATVGLGSIWISMGGSHWEHSSGDGFSIPITRSYFEVRNNTYSQVLLDFLMLNTDYEEINMPEDPVEYITLPAGVYIFDPVLQVPSNVGVYPIEFRSDGTVFYGMSLNTSSLSYGNSTLDAFAPVYDYSGTGWIITDYRWVMLETEQRVDKRLGDYILAETEYLSLDDYSYIYNQGYDSGYDQGYLEGKNLADSDSFIDGFFGDFFGGVRDALDSLVLYESTNTPIPIVVSVWDVISTLVMLFIVLFALKLVAGG